MGTDAELVNRRIWVDGPYCSCGYELDRYEKTWGCVECVKRYKIPRHLRKNSQRKIIKVFTAKSLKVGVLKAIQGEDA